MEQHAKIRQWLAQLHCDGSNVELKQLLRYQRHTQLFDLTPAKTIQSKLADATGMKAILARWALRVGQAWHARDLSGQAAGPWLTLQKSLAHRLIYRKVQAALGFDQARLLTSGAAPIAPESLAFFTGLNLVVRELYGQSEACGPSTLSLPGLTRIGSVGQALPGTEMTVADDGELLVRGPHIFQGYLGQASVIVCVVL